MGKDMTAANSRLNNALINLAHRREAVEEALSKIKVQLLPVTRHHCTAVTQEAPSANPAPTSDSVVVAAIDAEARALDVIEVQLTELRDILDV